MTAPSSDRSAAAVAWPCSSVLRLELIELGDAFRAYEQRTEPDLALLADLHERKARAFRLWADVSGDGSLRHEAHRAEKAAQITHEMHANRTGQPAGNTAAGDQPVVERLPTRQQAVHARTVLDYVQAHAPHPEAEVRLAVLMLTLRAARAGTGNVTGQDLTGWLPDDAEQVVQRLVAADWLCLPGTVAEVMASRSEDPVAVAVPALLPEQPRPFAFGKTTRGRISGWDQKVVGDRKIRKRKLGATTRLLALYTAGHTRLTAASDTPRTADSTWTRPPRSPPCHPTKSPNTPNCWSPPTGSPKPAPLEEDCVDSSPSGSCRWAGCCRGAGPLCLGCQAKCVSKTSPHIQPRGRNAVGPSRVRLAVPACRAGSPVRPSARHG
ncbi:hypothetical protein [Streptomyces hygroscopicus]|uniref:hypothetical protein n=1 Tax=Streptomyces hygroscopicus TaxID=1912 RepID=UPI00223EF743|nr:hypothetical protein [Streptomyces hygroscopicus]